MKFNIVFYIVFIKFKLMITIGAGFGLLGLSVLISDCILLNFTQKKKLFKKLKAVDAKEEFEKNPDLIKVKNEDMNEIEKNENV